MADIPSWVNAAIAIFAVVFGAGGFYMGCRIKDSHNTKIHNELFELIEHLDNVKQSREVCNERRTTYDVTFTALSNTMKEIRDDIKWLRGLLETRINGK